MPATTAKGDALTRTLVSDCAIELRDDQGLVYLFSFFPCRCMKSVSPAKDISTLPTSFSPTSGESASSLQRRRRTLVMCHTTLLRGGCGHLIEQSTKPCAKVAQHKPCTGQTTSNSSLGRPCEKCAANRNRRDAVSVSSPKKAPNGSAAGDLPSWDQPDKRPRSWPKAP